MTLLRDIAGLYVAGRADLAVEGEAGNRYLAFFSFYSFG
jgi:hypothetical protein